jgi:hypothetical protein
MKLSIRSIVSVTSLLAAGFLSIGQPESAVAEEKIVIYSVVRGTLSDPFWAVYRKGLEDAASTFGVDLRALGTEVHSVQGEVDLFNSALALRLGCSGYLSKTDQATSSHSDGKNLAAQKEKTGDCWRAIFSTLRSPALPLRPQVKPDSLLTAVPSSCGMRFVDVISICLSEPMFRFMIFQPSSISKM